MKQGRTLEKSTQNPEAKEVLEDRFPLGILIYLKRKSVSITPNLKKICILLGVSYMIRHIFTFAVLLNISYKHPHSLFLRMI